MRRSTDFVGRSSELSLLEDYFQRAVAGDQQLVLIEGLPGIGKTTLLLEFGERHARNRSARIFHLSAPKGEPYRPVHHAALAATNQRLYKKLGGRRQAEDVFRSLYLDWIGAVPVVGELVAAIVGTVERIQRRRTGQLIPSGASVDEDIAALLGASRRKPLILLFDDLDQVDAAEVARLEKLICDADEDARILIVGAYRTATPGMPHPPVKRLLRTLPNAGEFFAERRLAPLTMEEVRTLLEQRFPGAGITEAFVERLFETTAGHPATLNEALADLQFRGKLRIAEGRWVVDPDAAMPILGTAQTPNVDLSQLPPKVADSLRIASILGAEFDSSTLASLLETDELEVEDRLASAVHLGVLEASGEDMLPSGEIVSRFRFTAAHIVPVLREMLPPEQRRTLEERRAAAKNLSA